MGGEFPGLPACLPASLLGLVNHGHAFASFVDGWFGWT